MQLTFTQQRPLTGCLIAAPVLAPGVAGPVLMPFVVAAVRALYLFSKLYPR